MKTICIDFDGVIYKNLPYLGKTKVEGLPVEGAKEALENLSKQYNIVINSARFEDIETVEIVRRWMNENGMDYKLSIHKPHAHLYLDDRGINFNGSWEKAIKDIEEFKQWQEDEKKIKQNIKRMAKKGMYIIR